MRILATTFLAAALAFNLTADDKYKEKTKSNTTDPVTGEHVKSKSKIKAESDGDYKEDSKSEVRNVDGKTKTKRKVRVDDDGDAKEKVKVDGPNGKYESKTKIDR